MDYKEKVIALLNSQELSKEQKEKLETIFPELRESEDDRIRKKICKLLWDNAPYEEAQEYITWLEKQKTSEEALQYLKENHSPSEVSDFQAAMNIAVAKAYDKGYNDGLEKQCEQKPAEWSENDKYMAHHIGNAITTNEASCYLEAKNIEVIDAHVWLYSLKDRVQSKQEWNEEDNIILSRIIADYERSNEEWFNAQNSLPHGRKISWLKSLRLQSQWKPSDEQIEELRKHSDNVILRNLYYSLKKLKG